MVVKSAVFSLSVVLALAVHAQASVTASWTNTDNVYRFNISSSIGNITSLELSFAAAPGSTFATEFSDTVFDADGKLANIVDSFLLFPASVTSPGPVQAKTPTLLQAAFTGFTPFASKDVAQLVVLGNVATPIPASISRDLQYLAIAVVETVPGDRNSHIEVPILSMLDRVSPEISPRILRIDGNIGDLMNVQLVATDPTSATEDFVWSNLVVSGPGKNPTMPLANDPSLSADGVFSWNPSGWKVGRYFFYATVRDSSGNESPNSLALAVNYIPEPGSLWLLALGMIGFARVRR